MNFFANLHLLLTLGTSLISASESLNMLENSANFDPQVIGGIATDDYLATGSHNGCSFTAISDQVLITARHCFVNFNHSSNFINYFIQPANKSPHLVGQYDIVLLQYKKGTFKNFVAIDPRPVHIEDSLILVGFGVGFEYPAVSRKRFGKVSLSKTQGQIDIDPRMPPDLEKRYRESGAKIPEIKESLFFDTVCTDYPPNAVASFYGDSGGSYYRDGKLVGVVSGGTEYEVPGKDGKPVRCTSSFDVPLALPENIEFLRKMNLEHNLGIEGLEE
jgi:hypothetical protein